MDGLEERAWPRHRSTVLITVPNQHWVHKLVCHKLMLMMHDGRYRITVDMPSNKPFENNLHHIIVDFLKGDWDFWLTFDADNPPERNPLDLVELDKDIIGCPTPIWHYENKGELPIYWNAYDYDPETDAYREHRPREGLQKVDAVGTGCVLFARRVFEHPDMQKGAFTRKLNEDGTVDKGNDISASERAREAGFEIYAHYDYPAEHICEIPLNECARAFGALMNG